MMKHTLTGITGLLLILLAAACGPNTPERPALAVVSTPVEALPMNVEFIQQRLLPTPLPDEIISAADAEYLLLTNVYARVSPSVVNIEVVVAPASTPGFADLGRGSGFVLDLNGHIITNAHVVKDAREIQVNFNDGYVAPAVLVGLDTYSDLAVIRVNVSTDRLFPVTLGDSDSLQVGQRAIAIGNPFGLASSMTVGIVSGLGRQLRSAELIDNTAAPGFQNPSIIQVDTDINPGNSGGPLLNSKGEVIGVNTAIRTESGIFQGVGFAVPASTLKRVVPELIESGRVTYSWLGISSHAADNGFGVAGLAEPLKLPVNSGVLISAITPNSPADKAGLRGGTRFERVRNENVCVGGDIIVAVNDLYVKNLDELVAYLVVNTKPGDTINLLVVRDKETFTIPLTLEARPNEIGSSSCGRE